MSEVILKAVQDLGESVKSQVESAKVEAKKLNDEINAEVKKLNEELAAKGATIADLQNEIKEVKAKSGRIGNASQKIVTLKSIITDAIDKAGENFAREAKADGGIKLETKTVGDMTSANLTGDAYHTYLDYRPGMRPMGQTRFRDFVRVIPSGTDYVQFPRDTGGEGGFARQTNEGDAKSQVDRDFGMIDVTLKPIAGFATVSRQSLRNIPFLRTYLPESMLEDLLDKEDELFTADLVAAATGSTTATSATNELEKIIAYIVNLRKAKFNPNAIAIDPDMWSNVILTQTTGGGYNLPNVVAVDAAGTVRILGRPVYEVNWLTGGKVIVGDWSKTAIIESEGLSMRQSDSHASQFTSNEITYLLERVENVGVFRPDAFVYGDLD